MRTLQTVAYSVSVLEIQADAHKAYDYTSKGVVRADRTDLNEYKREFATTRDLHCLVEVDARN